MCEALSDPRAGQPRTRPANLVDCVSMRPTLGLGTAALAALFWAAPVRAQDLPDGDGKDLVTNVCTACHDLARIVSKHRSKEEWNDTVDKMATRGAKASDEEFDKIVTYFQKLIAEKGENEVLY